MAVGNQPGYQVYHEIRQASMAGTLSKSGGTLCSLSSASLETQLGEAGQSASLESATPRFGGRLPAQDSSDKAIIRGRAPIARALK